MHFSDALLRQVQQKKSVLCVGLDPHFHLLPDVAKHGRNETEAIFFFLSEILEAVSPFAVAVKPNTAFFECWGVEGWRILEKISEKAKEKNLLVIADAKRGDIGSTAEAYAEGFLGKNRPFDAITVSPYLGQDGIIPFAEKAEENEKGIFVLVKTSNKSAGEFQDLPVGDSLLHEEVARSVARIGTSFSGESGFSSVGAVVGATHPDDIRMLRSEMPAQIFLVPGYGAQGGTMEDIAPAFYANGQGAIVNSSRSILFASSGSQFAESAGKAAQKAQQELSTTVGIS